MGRSTAPEQEIVDALYEAREKARREGKMAISNEKYIRGLRSLDKRNQEDEVWEHGKQEEYDLGPRERLGVEPGSWEDYPEDN